MMRLRDLSLTQRLMLTVLTPLVVLSVATSALYLTYGAEPIELATRERGLAIASFFAPAAEYAVISGNDEGLDTMLKAALAQDGVVGVAVFSADGRPLARRGDLQALDPAWLATTARTRVNSSYPGRLAFAAPVRPTPIAVVEASYPASDTASVRALSSAAVAPAGWVYIELDTRPLEAAQRNVVLTAVLLSVGVLALAAIPAVRLAHRLGDPVARLADAVSRVAAGQLDVSVPRCRASAAREMRSLELGFNALSASIATAHRRINDNAEEATQMAYLALHDPLTGLLNRRAFECALEESVAASRRSGDHGMLCFIDLDHFKEVNDTGGHAAGDALLQDVAAVFGTRVRAEDRVYRIGGDEFAIILNGCTTLDARRIAETLCSTIDGMRFEWEGRQFRIGASIGMARIDDPSITAATLLQGADAACYVAKRRGRSGVVEYDMTAAAGHPHAA